MNFQTKILEPSGLLSIIKAEPKSNATKLDMQLVLNEIYRLRGEISALKTGYDTEDAEPGYIVHPSGDPLFREETGNTGDTPVH
jgi:hypothetical protein